MTDQPVIPGPDNREARLAAARGRLEFWTIWTEETTAPEAFVYFRSRKHHWVHVCHAIEMEPDPS